MTFQQELSSWFSPLKSSTPSSTPPSIRSPAPSPPILHLEPGRQTIIAFLRHCGCPFAEKTYTRMREAAKTHGDIDFVAVSHSSEEATQKWLKSLPSFGPEPGNLRVCVDEGRVGFGAYGELRSKTERALGLISLLGLGASSFAHVLDPRALSSAFGLKSEGFPVRPTESGSRWQTAGTFAIGGDGRVKFGGAAKRADDLPDFEEFVRRLNA